MVDRKAGIGGTHTGRGLAPWLRFIRTGRLSEKTKRIGIICLSTHFLFWILFILVSDPHYDFFLGETISFQVRTVHYLKEYVMSRKKRRSWLLSIFFVVVFAFSAHASTFQIDLTMTGFTSSQEAIFTDAESYWESAIDGYQPDIFIFSLNISAKSEDILEEGVLGSASVTFVTPQGGFLLATAGNMIFDNDYIGVLSSDSFYDVILHEMAHVIGFGILWSDNDVYTEGSGQYTGAAALLAYKYEFDPFATFVPVELGEGAEPQAGTGMRCMEALGQPVS